MPIGWHFASALAQGSAPNAAVDEDSGSRPLHRSFFWPPLLRDANDDTVLEAALSGHADMQVTFNQRDFEPGTSALGIDVLVPREALQRIKEKR
jgi:hypothetical protein